ncbi:MAG: tRNA-dihydrouridine synthase family protein [Promethearchaeota archaeon]
MLENLGPAALFTGAGSRNPVLALAPMEPATANPIVRELAGRGGAALVYRPKVLPQHLLKARKWQFIEAIPGTGVRKFHDGIQLLAKPGDPIGAAVRFVEKWKDKLGIHFVDLNFGCPRSRVVNAGRGGGLLRSPKSIRAVVEEVVSNTSLPVSAKIRTGFTLDDHPRAVCGALLDAGVSWIVVNRVPVKFGYEVTREVRDAFRGVRAAVEVAGGSVPVIGNGGISGPGDARLFLKKTGCRGLMVGRAALGNPRVFGEIASTLSGGGPGRSGGGALERRPPALDFPALLKDLFETISKYARLGKRQWVTIGQVKRLVYPYLQEAWLRSASGVPRGCGRASWPRRRFNWETLRDFLASQFGDIPASTWRRWIPPQARGGGSSA